MTMEVLFITACAAGKISVVLSVEAVDPGQLLRTGMAGKRSSPSAAFIFSDKKKGTHNRAPVFLLPTKSLFFKYAGTPIFQKCYPQCYPRGF
jgi:hypothetical protein